MIQVKTIKAKFIGYQSDLVVEFDGETSGTIIVGGGLYENGHRSENFTSVFDKEIWQILEISEANVVEQSEQLKALEDLKQWCFETCQPFEEERLHEILKRL